MSRIVPQLPNSPLTPNVISVPTTTGFAAGDLVYFNATNGNYGPIPNAALTSAPVNIVQNAPIYSGSAFNSIFQSHTPIGSSTAEVNTQGVNNSKYGSAILTNGNIVYTWINRVNTRPVFQIETQAGVVVVPATNTTTTFTAAGGTGYYSQVIALTGGGFVLFFGRSNGELTFAVYANDGTVVSAFADAGFGANSSYSQAGGVALPNGKFVLARQNNSSQLQYRVFEANGTPTFSVTTAPVSSNDPGGMVAMAARSDNSVLLFYPAVNSTSFQYILHDTTINSVIATSSFSDPVGSARGVFPGVTCLSNDTFVMAFTYQVNSPTTGTAAAFRFLPVGNVLGATTTIGLPAEQPLFPNTFSSTNGINVRRLSGGGFICAWNDGGGSINYKFFNSSGTLISSTAPGTINSFGIKNYNDIDLLEYGGAVAISASTVSTDIGSWWPFIRISTTTYQPLISPSVQNLLGTVSVATGNYLPSSSTPSAASFLSATSLTSSITVPLSTQTSLIAGVTDLASFECDSIMPAALTNGRYVIVYKQTSSPFAVTAVVLSSTGGTIQTINVGNGINILRTAKVAAMSNGGFVVSFASDQSAGSGANVITSRVYSPSGSSYSLTSTSTVTDVWNFATNYALAVTGLSNNRFAVAYNQTSSYFPRIQVFNSAGVQLQAAVGANISGYENFDVTTSGINGTDIVIHGWVPGAGQWNAVRFTESAAGNAWTLFGTFNIGGGNAQAGNHTRSLPNGGYVFAQSQGSTTAILRAVSSQISNTIQTSGFGMASNTIAGCAVGVTGFGSMLSFTSTSTNQLNINIYNPNFTNFSGGISNFSITGNSLLVSNSNMNAGVAGGQGYQALLTWLGNSPLVPRFAIINAYPFVESVFITAGVTPTSPAPLEPNGFFLTGVAANTAPAGGFGNVITNGSAVLNNNYSATTPFTSFDFQNPALFGVKGTIAGRNINLQGNN